MADPDAGPNQPATTPESIPDGELARATILFPVAQARRVQAAAEFAATPEVTLPGGFKRRRGVRTFAD